jgi:hypothetical protein
MSSIYQINKGINKPIVFKGLQGQYISWLAAGLVCLLILFAILFISGLPMLLVLPLILSLGCGLFLATSYLSRRFGTSGLEKHIAKRSVPVYLKFKSRRIFTGLTKGVICLK